MKFLTALPATFIYHRFRFHGRMINHGFGTTDTNGILEVPDDDRYIDILKAKYSPIEGENTSSLEIIGKDIKSNTTPIIGDTDKKEGKPNVNDSKASSSTSPRTNRAHAANTAKDKNSKKRSGRSVNNSRQTNAGASKNHNG